MSNKLKIFFMIEIGCCSIILMGTPIIYIASSLDNNPDFAKEYLFNIRLINNIGPILWLILTTGKLLLLLFILQLLFTLPIILHALIMKKYVTKVDIEIIFRPYVKVFEDKILFPIVGRYYKRLLSKII